ncbi:hypothetical protein PFISCL1PPCAC_6302 [Pristionchus fissidentatus]|uniref:FIP-RBD domain-containing protein n=1 Tax=Pristionchus fissidentatus TaxID=1538716 RepID=A0AAV5V5Y1_9BILA|nr:hypothetical protein PFISCL1PPCAC_6302 [Pristionchus fissidentatus]
MEPNNLVVTVQCARGLMLKGQSELHVSTSLCLQGKGSLRSKCVTEKVDATTDAQWNEGCEFKIMEGANKITATVNHHTRMGGTDLIGKCEIPLSDVIDVTSPTWFPLHKKAKDEKYRGEVLLQFAFSYVKPQLSVSNMSLNTIPKNSVLDKMKKKMGKLGKNGRDKDSLSVFSAFAPSMHKMDRHDTAESMNKTYHGESNFTRSGSIVRRPLNVSIPAPIGSSSPYNSPSLNRNDYIGGSNINISNISTAESFGNISQLQRQSSRRSFASSGFGSSKSKKKEEEKQWCPSEWGDLASEVDRLRAELTVKDSRLKDMEEYLDTLLKKVMEHHPELLAAGPKMRNQLPQLTFNYR